MQYEIKGNTTPVVICDLQEGEPVITECGSMVWMSPNMEMRTLTGGIGSAFGRLFSGDSFFINSYTPYGGPGKIAFASNFPGTIAAIQITPETPIIIQKSAFLAAESTVNVSMYLQKKLGAGFFGGEGFIMQKLSGNGIAFVELDGFCEEYPLAEDEEIIINTGNLAMMSASCSIDIKMVKGVKNLLLGGEGVFHTKVKGPGNVVVQSMTLTDMAGALYHHMPIMPNNQQ